MSAGNPQNTSNTQFQHYGACCFTNAQKLSPELINTIGSLGVDQRYSVMD